MNSARVQENQISVTCEPGASATLVVRDNGAGMKPDVLKRVFEPFFTTRAVGEGTGLGLWVCHRIADELGGSLELESTVGRGTTARLHLVKTSPEPVAASVESAAEISSEKHRVLVIDDDVLVARGVRRQLAEHDVTIAASGSEGLQLLLSEQRFDLVICDLMMPGLDGQDIHRELQIQRPGMEDQLVFMTGGAITERAKEFLNVTHNTCLHKPCDGVKLRALAAKHLECNS